MVQLEVFIAVAEELHFRRAAERLYAQPSSVSTAIKDLEREMGVALFDRTSRRVELTDAGEAFLTSARSILQDLAVAVDQARSAADERRVVIRGGMFDEGAAELNQPIVELFQSRYPRAEVVLLETPYDRIRDDLLSGKLDAVLCGCPDVWFPSGLPVDVTPLFAEGRSLIVPAHSDLAAASSLELDSALDRAFLALDAPIMHVFGLWAERNDERDRDRSIEAFSAADMFNAIAMGKGAMSVTHASSRFYPRPDIVYVPVPAMSEIVVAAVRRKEEHRQHVIDFCSLASTAAETSLDLIPTAQLAMAG